MLRRDEIRQSDVFTRSDIRNIISGLIFSAQQLSGYNEYTEAYVAGIMSVAKSLGIDVTPSDIDFKVEQMKLRSNLLLTDFGREELIRGNLVISDGFIEFNSVKIEFDGEFLKIALLIDDKEAVVVDEIMVVKNGWSVELRETIGFRLGVRIE